MQENINRASQALPHIGGEEMRRLLSMRAAVDVLRTAFRDFDASTSILRAAHSLPAGAFLFMPASDARHVGVKMVGVAPGNAKMNIATVQAIYVLFDAQTLAPLATMQGDALTDIRTPAVSALATDLAARADARHLAIVGSGAQATGHVLSMLAVRPIEVLSIVARNPDTAARLAAFARDCGIADVRVTGREALSQADIICTCTTSTEPVIASADVKDGCHVNAVGAFHAGMRELDGELLARGRLMVEDRASALQEAGDILLAMEAGHFGPEALESDLREAVSGHILRRDEKDVTIFKSVGIGFEDLVIASEVYRLRNAGRNPDRGILNIV
ncbi:ornithine cyclodeaminase family protein [Paracoccus denitrificans]|uniref:ornithine cyclodeaminase family protein n=1 Tax=Paracoccus denitrificans TaxID=266 RepID=UPI000CEC1096|nr:ornithine cyclodeaminase family protein [Paracoccus denitrificans]